MSSNNLLMFSPSFSPWGLCRSLDGHNKIKTRHHFGDEQHIMNLWSSSSGKIQRYSVNDVLNYLCCVLSRLYTVLLDLRHSWSSWCMAKWLFSVTNTCSKDIKSLKATETQLQTPNESYVYIWVMTSIFGIVCLLILLLSSECVNVGPTEHKEVYVDRIISCGQHKQKKGANFKETHNLSEGNPHKLSFSLNIFQLSWACFTHFFIIICRVELLSQVSKR